MKIFMTALLLLLAPFSTAFAAQKPNILVIFGDDVGMWNISAYHRGMMGGRTPNIDRIASEGALLSLIHISEPTRPSKSSRMPSSA